MRRVIINHQTHTHTHCLNWNAYVLVYYEVRTDMSCLFEICFTLLVFSLCLCVFLMFSYYFCVVVFSIFARITISPATARALPSHGFSFFRRINARRESDEDTDETHTHTSTDERRREARAINGGERNTGEHTTCSKTRTLWTESAKATQAQAGFVDCFDFDVDWLRYVHFLSLSSFQVRVAKSTEYRSHIF